MVRLRRFIEQGVAALRLTLEQQKSLDPDFSSLPGLTDFAGELVEMEEAVAELPLEFKQRSSESSPSSVGSLEVL
jgi:hypothetical protein